MGSGPVSAAAASAASTPAMYVAAAGTGAVPTYSTGYYSSISSMGTPGVDQYGAYAGQGGQAYPSDSYHGWSSQAIQLVYPAGSSYAGPPAGEYVVARPPSSSVSGSSAATLLINKVRTLRGCGRVNPCGWPPLTISTSGNSNPPGMLMASMQTPARRRLVWCRLVSLPASHQPWVLRCILLHRQSGRVCR